MLAKERYGVEWKDMELSALLQRALGIGSPEGSSISIRDICEDSRRVTPGALFVAVPGTKTDGIGFIPDAIARGAAALVVAESAAIQASVPIIRVADPRHAVARLASVFFGLDEIQRTGGLKVVGVTGTNGKSTFAYMVRHLFTCAGRRTALLGTIEYDLVSRKFGADLTTPDAITLARHLVEAHRSGATHAVIEASSHSLDQRRTDGIDFCVGVFTNLTQDHLDYHGTIENYSHAKRRLFDGLSPNAVAVVNAHDPASTMMVERCRGRVIRYGIGEGAKEPQASARADVAMPPQVRGTILHEDRDGGIFLLEYEGKRAEIRTPMVGRYNILNALAAAATALASGFDMAVIQRGIGELENVPGRLQRVATGNLGFDVFVDYAHTDDALRNVLSALRPLSKGRLWCLFGCGGDRDRTKRPKMARAVAEGADSFIITSDNPRTEDPVSILADVERGLRAEELSRGVTILDRSRAIEQAIGRLEPGDTLVIAGKGHENYQIIGTTKHHFDDVEAAAAAIETQARRLCHSEEAMPLHHSKEAR